VAASVVITLVLLGVSLALAEHQFEPKTELMLQLLRVMFPYMLLVCLAAAFMGMLNARGHFFIPAMGATVLNVVMIASVLWLAPHMGQELSERIFALAYGVLVAGVAQAAFQLPTLYRDGFRYHWVSPRGNETVQRVVRQMIPGAIGVAAFQINVMVVQGMAFWVGNGIVSSFTGAVRLMELPQGMFGISLATYLLPTLSGLAAEKNYTEFRSTLRHGLGTLIFLNLIATILLIVLAVPIVRLLFERGAFSSASTKEVAFALMCLAPGLIAFSTVNILARAFYALGDTRTPMKISIMCLALNLVFAAVLLGTFAPGYKQGGLGIANTLSAIGNVFLLVHALRRKLARLEMSALKQPFGVLAGAGLVTGLITWWSSRFWEGHFGHGTLMLKVGAVFGPAVLGGLVYWLLSFLGKVPAAREITELVFRRLRGASD
jgi:putative peptidoglycan lipid II flippase